MVLPETTVEAGEGEIRVVENYQAMVGNINSITVGIAKPLCSLVNVEVQYGE